MEQSKGKILVTIIAGMLKHNLTLDTNSWLMQVAASINEEKNGSQLNLAFASVPRKTGKLPVKVAQEEKNGLKAIHPEYSLKDWTVDRLARVWILLQVDPVNKENYFRKLESLFKAAEMNELVALYSALPGFYYPDIWQQRCAEGIRSNIGNVLEAIMYNNPYPYENLNELAWNQLVMKAFFTDKDVNRIIGLDERANKELASILIDYANERWSAHRVVNPQLWRLVSGFIDSSNFFNIERAFHSGDPIERKGAALACYNSSFEPARQMVEKEPELKSAIAKGELNWGTL